MMFGLREEFDYLECSRCGCVQLCQPPSDFSKYYPADYYSFQPHGWAKTFLRRQWSAYAFHGWNPLGWLVTKRFAERTEVISVRRANIPFSARILDVGCGAGHLIDDLWHLGFKKVQGVDPFIEHDLVHHQGFVVLKKDLRDLAGEYDLIMLHHSFEHMDRPDETMYHLRRLLASSGMVILRIPIAASFAWKHYGVNWVNLDAPRHLFLHSPESIKILAARTGLTVCSMVYEGDAGTFWGSEQYRQGIPLRDPRSYASNRKKSIFTPQQIREFQETARELNARKEGDLACFYLTKSPTHGKVLGRGHQ
jgi:SAM-dependent methyltransferase